MGAWGSGPFENDDASDWVYEFEEAPSLGVCRDALEQAGLVNGYLEVTEGARALAAAEVVAAAAGRRGVNLPRDIGAWIDAMRPEPTPADLALARRAVERVMAGDSELAELWSESDSAIEWLGATDDLLSRLS